MASNNLVTYPAGSYIFREGDVGNSAYLIETGKVLISVTKDKDSVPVAVLGPGELIGEMAIIDGLPRSASAFAVEETEVSLVSETLLSERMGAADPIVQLLVSVLIRRLRNVNMQIKGQLNISTPERLKASSLDLVARSRLKLENDLIQGLARKEFFLVYQGIFDLSTRELLGFEALARWNNPERGLVPPSEFIDVAEQTSFILPLGDWILEQGFKDLLFLQKELGRPDLTMSINVSARQLNDAAFANRIKKLNQKIKVNPNHVKLEVTERVFQQGEHILSTVKKVGDQGFSFAMDDFGTGYASLTSLFNMKVDTIKVDRSFVSTLTKDPRSKAIVQAIMAMAVELGVDVVAEGIEHEEEALLLQAIGCHLGQGYLFAKPKAIAEVLEIFGLKKSAA